MPPSRYRVVERGRRLVVIDNRSGEEVTPAARRAADPARASLAPAPPAKAGVEDGQVVTTQGWYDARAPRRIPLNFANRARLKGAQGGLAAALIAGFVLFFVWPLLPFLAVVLLFGLRKQIRTAATAFIDTLQTA